jgi:SAM-dependent methyltransferase
VNAYGPELAAAHHAGYGDTARGAARVLAQELARTRMTAGLVVDLGAGTGILAKEIGDLGFDVLGVDISPDMVAIAEATAPAARFVVSSFVDVELPPCVAVTMVGEIVNYAFDPRSGRAQLSSLFTRVHDALVPGGVLLFDAAGPGRAGPTGNRCNARDAGESFVVAHTVQDGDVLTRDITMFTRDGERWRRSDEHHTLHLYEPADLTAALRATGFRVRRMRTYDGVELGPGMSAFVARRPR